MARYRSHSLEFKRRVAQEVAGCRTFLLEEEATEFRRQGLGGRLTPADLLVFGPRGPIDNRLGTRAGIRRSPVSGDSPCPLRSIVSHIPGHAAGVGGEPITTNWGFRVRRGVAPPE